ncbi:L-ascorbate metabolism protein UlaG, beta-lactamase superfamily [bacterium A37T11]|nr:L-ascorbate metabolism protein UlaG, beta-lactamase superfamily [bacterium A37T11]
MKATYFGQSCVQLELNGATVLLDPFISYNPLAKEIDIDTLMPDYIFLSHGHGDHVADVVHIQKNSGAQVAAIVETAAWVGRQGVDEAKITSFNFGGTLQTAFGSVKIVYALHTNQTPDGQYGGVAAGFVFKSGGKTIYFAGDTALTLEMKLLERYQIDWAFLPIGGHYTMDVEDAIIAADFIRCKNIVGIHYNTFPPITIDTQSAVAAFEKAGLTLHLPAIGGSLNL